jgi:hypothetical protein
MNNSKHQGIVRGEVVNGINMPQLAEDIVFLLPNNTGTAKKLKFLLCAFEQISVLKFNFLKLIIFFGKAESEEYRRIFTCQIGNLPMKYLRMLVNYD